MAADPQWAASVGAYPMQKRNPLQALGGDPRGLLSNPGGAGALRSQIYERVTTRLGGPIPVEIAGPALDRVQNPRAIPPRGRTESIEHYTRSALPFVGLKGVVYPVPRMREIAFIYSPPSLVPDKVEKPDRKEIETSSRLHAQKQRAMSKLAAVSYLTQQNTWTRQLRAYRSSENPATKALFHLVHTLGLESLNHYLASLESERMRVCIEQMNGKATNDEKVAVWQAFINEMFEGQAVPTLAASFPTDGIIIQSSDRTPRYSPIGSDVIAVEDMVRAGRVEVHNYPKGRKVLEGNLFVLVWARVPMTLAQVTDQPNFYKMATTLDELQTIPPRPVAPWAVNPPLAYQKTIYPVQVVPVCVSEQMPARARGYEVYTTYPTLPQDLSGNGVDGPAVVHTDGFSRRVGRILHRGGQPANGNLAGSYSGYDDMTYDPTKHATTLKSDLVEIAQRYPPMQIHMELSYD